jgi:hypothetical protein
MASEWLVELVLIAILVILLGLGRFWLQMRSSYRRRKKCILSAFNQIPVDNEYRAVIFKAYERLATNLKRYGLIRKESETVRQFLARVPEHQPIDKAELRDFLDIFEKARYSDRPCGENERSLAIGSLRGLQYSLEQIKFTQEQLAELAEKAQIGADPIEPTPATKQTMNLWVVAPFVPGPVVVKADPVAKYRELVMPRDGGKDELIRMLGPANAGPDARLPDIYIVRLKKLLGNGDSAGLGQFLLELAGGLAKGWRARVDPSLVSYLLEFEQRLSESGRFRRQPRLDDSVAILRASTVLAIADGRDFLVPDDLKLALLGAGPFVYHTDLRDVMFVLDEEIREVRMPRGPAFMRPEPVRVRGLTVPAV